MHSQELLPGTSLEDLNIRWHINFHFFSSSHSGYRFDYESDLHGSTLEDHDPSVGPNIVLTPKHLETTGQAVIGQREISNWKKLNGNFNYDFLANPDV